MSTTIRRGGKGVRRAAAAKGKARAVRKAKEQTNGFAERLLRAMPISERGLQRFFLFLILAGLAVVVWIIAQAAGVPEVVRARAEKVAIDAGLAMRRVDVRGVRRMDDLAVQERAFARPERALPFYDIHALREDLLAMPWVREARVSRQYPDRLVIDIVERAPHAVLRQGENFVLIDQTGHRLAPLPAAKAQKMLVLSGPGAEKRALELARLLDAAPALKPQVRGAEWVGNRRWNLTFISGQVVALPEGEDQAADALVSFARLDGTSRLLGGKVAVFDMRADDRIYMRVPGRAAEQAKLAAERKRAAAAQGTEE